MYVDKPLLGVRAHPQKYDVFVVEFQNNIETIEKAFEPYYRITHSMGERSCCSGAL
jgi:type I restriction enzyme, R subunit